MRPFEGFQRKAVVIVPSNEEYKRRCAEREKEEGKDVPESAVNEMKGRMMLQGGTMRRVCCHLSLSQAGFRVGRRGFVC